MNTDGRHQSSARRADLGRGCIPWVSIHPQVAVSLHAFNGWGEDRIYHTLRGAHTLKPGVHGSSDLGPIILSPRPTTP